jgi:hypothetical protein
MPQTYTNNPASLFQGVGRDYAMNVPVGRIGECADISTSLIVSGNNETTGRIPFGVPLARNGSGVLPNSVSVAAAAGAILGLSVLTDVHEISHRLAAVPYQEGIEPGDAVNILKQGAIYLDVFQAVTTANPLRYYRTGVNAGRWGTASSAGVSLLLTAGNWEIERGAGAGGLLTLRINAPGALTFTADV